MDLSETFRVVNSKIAAGRLSASYYPYRELKHTWRSRDGLVMFRVSDYLRGTPEEVIESLAWYLICRARGVDCPEGMSEKYLSHIGSHKFWSDRRDLYVGRAKNLAFRAKGSERDLGTVFDYVNACYFGGKLDTPELAWASESPSRRVGFFHAPLRILAVNRALDSARVPRYVLEFVVYHELLHGLLDVEDGVSGRIRHTAEFRKKERAFARYDEAHVWLARIAHRRRIDGVVPQV